MEKRSCDVLVIGGGIIGMSSAYELSQRGYKVIVIDKGDIGYGCSYGNAGWITPCFSMPLPMPGMLLKSVRWLLDPESPLYIKPQPSFMLMNWLVRFLFSMNYKHMHRSVAALTELSKISLDAYSQLNEKSPTFGFEQKGLLMAAQTQAGLDYAIKEMNLVSEHGVPGRQMNAEETRNFEPALTGLLTGAVYFPKEAHAEPLQVVQTLRKFVDNGKNEVLEKAELYDFGFKSDGSIDHVKTTRGDIRATNYVLAAGSWSAHMGKALDLRIPVLGGKGYSMILKPFSKTPKVPLMLVERKVAVTPRANTVRVAGTIELVNQDFTITQRRVNAIIKGAKAFMDIPDEPEKLELWRGLRPCTPDGVPIISRSKRHKNLVIATGHQMLGLQSGMGTGRLVSDIISESQPVVDLNPFRDGRF